MLITSPVQKEITADYVRSIDRSNNQQEDRFMFHSKCLRHTVKRASLIGLFTLESFVQQ